MSNEKTTRSVADDNLKALGLEKEKKPERRSYGGYSHSGALFDRDDEDWLRGRSGGYNSYSRASRGEDDDWEPPAFLRKGEGGGTRSSATSPRKHTSSERTAQYAPHSYIKAQEGSKFEVGDTMKLAEAAQFSPAAATFIARRVKEAMADALEQYGMIWSSKVATSVQDFIYDSLSDCTYKKPVDGGGSQYVAVRIGESELDKGGKDG